MEDGGDRSSIIEAIDDIATYAVTIGLIPKWHWWITMMMMDKLKLESSFEKIINFVNKHLNDRVSGRTKLPEDCSDFFEKMLPMEVKGKATRFHTLWAVARTIAISLSVIIAYLTMNPDTLVALRREVVCWRQARLSHKLSGSMISRLCRTRRARGTRRG